jgi:hypothetical protein
MHAKRKKAQHKVKIQNYQYKAPNKKFKKFSIQIVHPDVLDGSKSLDAKLPC